MSSARPFPAPRRSRQATAPRVNADGTVATMARADTGFRPHETGGIPHQGFQQTLRRGVGMWLSG